MEREKYFFCPNCLIDFAIQVEPNYDIDTIREELPQSIEWLEKIEDCPVCGESLGVR